MLNAPAPFPQVGSYALYPEGGDLALVRIQHRIDRFGAPHAMISLVRTWRASGNKLVPLADLVDGTPLTAAEAAEQLALFGKLLSAKRASKADRARQADLHMRSIHARLLEEKLRRAGLDRIAA